MRRPLPNPARALVVAALLTTFACSSSSGPATTRVDTVDVGATPSGDVAAELVAHEDIATGCTSNDQCDDGNPCTLDFCDVAGLCVYTPVDGDCADDDACTVDEHCEEGQCVMSEMLCEEDDDPCTIAICDAAVGCTWSCAELPGCVMTCERDDDCDDNDAESLDTCVRTPCSSECRHSWPACDDENPCTIDYRSEGGACAHAPLDGEPCDDANACTVDDECQQEQCAGLLVSCDDGNPCTSDYCDRDDGCQHAVRPDGLSCDDGLVCTRGDTCYDGACLANPVVCVDDGDPCTLNDVCVEPFGCDVDCGTGADCQRDLCQNDGDCTDVTPCVLGRCVENFCHRHCVYDVENPCDDGDLCTIDSCLAGVGCQHERVCQPCIVDAECDDDDACTLDHCGDDSLCRQVPLTCPDDGNRCTEERCDSEIGCTFVCVGCAGGSTYCNTEDDERCDDGDACTVDSCEEGPCGRDCRNEPMVCEERSLCDEPACLSGTCLHAIRAAVPSIDGVIDDDWHPESVELRATEPIRWEEAYLGEVRLQHDAETLYVGLAGNAPGADQAIVGYLDVDLGDIDEEDHLPAGIQYTKNLGGTGALDAAVANGLSFLAADFGADFAFGTVGMASAFGEAERAGWREIRLQTAPQRVPGSAVLTSPESGHVEAVIPFAALWPDGVPLEGARMAIVLVLVNIGGDCPTHGPPALPPQGAPWPDELLDEPVVENSPDAGAGADVVGDTDVTVEIYCPSPVVDTVYGFLLRPERFGCCEDVADCRDGDPCTEDICRLGGRCTYVYGACE